MIKNFFYKVFIQKSSRSYIDKERSVLSVNEHRNQGTTKEFKAEKPYARSLKDNIPNILTVSRIILIPVMIIAFYTPGKIGNLVAATIFTIASLTDYFDGYFARMLNHKSNFGKCLDPIADKLLVAAAMIMLVHFGKKDLAITIPGIVIISREILVSGLREFLAEFKVEMPVSKLAKYKTGIQMTAIGILIMGEDGSRYALREIFGASGAEYHDFRMMVSTILNLVGKIMLSIAAILTIVTGYSYLKIGIKKM